MSRYRYFDSKMQPCQGGSPEHVFTADDRQQITIVVDPLGGKEVRADKADVLIAACRLGGHADWRLPEVEEEFLTCDRTRYAPAKDPVAFPRQPKHGWVWTATNSSASLFSVAWVVNLNYGHASPLRRGTAYVRAVRSGVPPITS